ncbi:hypothetical protein [Mucilaginibacter aquaedulcis]|uniref:hypothetical protein n=1 Tax=Mucilaginibacter aquaedulcis TaxID=1187081 RepID=UPI0025B57B70|nr:hypothetical protein [Mucilaginibacter aquaedulcis]MDN3550944.1 hypothetical protein [Mucilaginibacter aquaedulcis]
MKYLFCLLLLIVQAPLFLHAQSNYKPGYVVNSKNDTLKGFIDYREWIKNPKEVNFKQAPGATVQRFSPANANGFAITNAEYYEKFIVKVSTSEIETEKLSLNIDTAFVTDTVFLKNLVNGKKVSLYVLTTDLKSSFYVMDKSMREIDYLKQYQFYDTEHQTISNVNIYTNQLLRLAYRYQPDNKRLPARILGTSYLEGPLKAVAIAINGGKTTQQAVHSSSGIRFFAGAGINRSKLQFNGHTDLAPFRDGTHDNHVSPVLAAGIDFLANKFTEKIVFRFELQATTGSYQFSETSSGVYDTKSSLAIKQYMFSGIPQIMYNFYNADKLKAFIDIGLSMNVYKYDNYNYFIARTYGSTTSVDKQNLYPNFEDFTFSVPVKAGVQINKRVELYGTYRLPTSVTRYTLFSADQSSFQAGVNYIFR